MALLAASVAVTMGGACGSSSNDPEAFVGSWSFSGTLTPNCGTALPIAVMPFDVMNEAVTIVKVDAMHIALTAGTAGCVVNFSVSGMNATAVAGQSCTIDVPQLGAEQITVSSWALALSGDSIANAISGTVLGVCTVSGTGTLTKQTDAGAAD